MKRENDKWIVTAEEIAWIREQNPAIQADDARKALEIAASLASGYGAGLYGFWDGESLFTYALAKVWEAAATWRPDGGAAFPTYCYKQVWCACRNYKRDATGHSTLYRRGQFRVPTPLSTLSRARDEGGRRMTLQRALEQKRPDPAAEARLDAVEFRIALEQSLSLVESERGRTALSLWIAGLTWRDVGREMGTSGETARLYGRRAAEVVLREMGLP